MLYLPGVARAQSGGASVTVSGGVSKTVALSFAGGAKVPGDRVRVTSGYDEERALTLTISGTTRELTEVSIPVQIRSNTAYRLLATAKSDGSNLSSLLVVNARPTGRLVAADAAEALSVAGMFEARPGAGKLIPSDGFRPPSLSPTVELLSGPRVSLGGTLESPQNALEVTLSVAVEPREGNQAWSIELLLSAVPAARS